MGSCHEYDPKVKELLESLFDRYHRREYIHPDPLEQILCFEDVRDREVAGLVVSALSFGRVASILNITDSVLSRLSSPYADLVSKTDEELRSLFSGFRYRFYGEREIGDLLAGIRAALLDYGSLNALFLNGYKESGGDYIEAQNRFTTELNCKVGAGRSMLSLPSRGSSCKKMNLFFKWLIRCDEVDPGGWTGIEASELIMPLDTHIYQISRILGFTERRSANLRTAVEITEALKLYDESDPTRFDFSLSRLGIHPDLTYEELISSW